MAIITLTGRREYHRPFSAGLSDWLAFAMDYRIVTCHSTDSGSTAGRSMWNTLFRQRLYAYTQAR